MQEYKNILTTSDFDKQLKKLEKKYKNKKIILYGAGTFFKAIKKYYDLSNLNIVAISDISFNEFITPIYDEELGYHKISPYHINDLTPNIVLITTLKDYFIEKYFCENLFKEKKYRFKYDRLFKKKVSIQIMEEYFL